MLVNSGYSTLICHLLHQLSLTYINCLLVWASHIPAQEGKYKIIICAFSGIGFHHRHMVAKQILENSYSSTFAYSYFVITVYV